MSLESSSPLSLSSFVYPSKKISSKAHIKTMEQYQQMCLHFDKDYVGTWARLARETLDWKKPFKTVLNDSNPPFFKWFEDGMLNASYNCLDRQVKEGLGDKVAIIFESDEGHVSSITYSELLKRVCRFANGLRQLGVGEGDTVIIYMPMSIEGIVAMQACARIGAIHSVVFGGFSAKSLFDRIVDVGAKLVITADEQLRGGRWLPLKSTVDEALSMGECAHLKHVVVFRRSSGRNISWNQPRDIWLHEMLDGQSDVCEPAWVSAEHPLFVLYTSGSTGTPKGIQHSTGGYLLWATLTMMWTFDIKSDDVFWCTADIGWITGHSYVCYGPLSIGATQVVFEGVPTYPNAGRFWEMIDKHGVSIFYTAPTAIRALIKASSIDEKVHPRQYDLSSLRLLGSVGEPINPEAWRWYYQEVGKNRCPIVDTFWQTETGGHMISPLPGATPMIPGSCTLPLPGIQAAVVDEAGVDVPHGQGGLLVIKKPWPSMLRNIWGNSVRYQKAYFPEELGGLLYLAGDGTVRNPDTGYFTITGRIDDVLNVSGHRLGTMEIESSLVAHPLVAEAAVVGAPDEITGEAVVAFVVLKRARPNQTEALSIATELRSWVTKGIGAIAKPKDIYFEELLPKTRSGKIMRRLLRTIVKGEEITQDISTLENPNLLKGERVKG